MKHVLITGASSGIGRAIAEALIQREYFVWVAARNPSTVEDLVAQAPSRTRALKLDVTDGNEIREAVRTISAAPGITEFILVNNAGVAVGGPFECIPIREYRSVFDVNVFGLVEMTQAALPLLRKTRGRVINIGSISGRISSPFMSPYTGAKFAVRAINDALRREMMKFGVEVALIEPGPIATAIWDKSVQRSRRQKA